MSNESKKIANRDKILQGIQSEINLQQLNVLRQMSDLEKNKEENEFLKQVFEDYKKYKDHIINQKKDQKLFLEGLISYLDKTKAQSEITERMIEKSKFEERDILNRLKKVKQELNDLIIATK
tara:strand:- start:2491 stop:2856 length:366 start_codon:yes stop_codon:yes gene_type:complete